MMMAPSSSVELGWAWLPHDLLDSIADCLVEFSDFLQFLSVCKPWRSIALEPPFGFSTHHHYLRLQQTLHLLKTCRNNPQLPILLVTPTKDNSSDKRSLHGLISSSENNNYNYEIQLTMSYPRRFIGSSHGWLFTCAKSMVITMINPFLYRKFCLPEFPISSQHHQDRDKHDYFIEKAILLTSNPATASTKVLLIYGSMRRLAYLNFAAGKASNNWELIEVVGGKGGETSVFSDIIYHKGQVYAVSFYSALVRVDVSTCRGTVVVAAAGIDFYADTTYLVESVEGDLLLVRRLYEEIKEEEEDVQRRRRKTWFFEVYKLSYCEHGAGRWDAVERIGEQALFLGDNQSVAISTIDYPVCKPNCIYYVHHSFPDSYIPRGIDDDTGIYNMEDESFGLHYTPPPHHSLPSQPSIWIVPNFKSTR